MFANLTVNNPNVDRPLLVHHVAKRCGLSGRMVRYLASAGQIPGFRNDSEPKIWRFRKADVDLYIQQRKRRRACVQ